MGQNSGTIRKVVIDGITFDVFADAKGSYNRSKYEIEGQATTGKTMYKMTKRVQVIEGVDLACSPNDRETLAAKSESLADVTLAITWADGSTDRGSGRVKFDKWESDTNKATVDLIPNGEWTPFLVD